MSGVYIKGIKLPTIHEGQMVIRIEPSGKADVQWSGMVGGEYTKAVELPAHGDLIERDALMAHKGSAYDIDGHELYAVGTGTILRMPVVIPAERSEE